MISQNRDEDQLGLIDRPTSGANEDNVVSIVFWRARCRAISNENVIAKCQRSMRMANWIGKWTKIFKECLCSDAAFLKDERNHI